MVEGDTMSHSILKDVRSYLEVDKESDIFDEQILMHLNTAIGILYQNGVGKPIVVDNDSITWDDFKDQEQVEGNEVFSFVKTFIFLRTKILFDPPPPSAVESYKIYISELLWRIRVWYEKEEVVK